MSKVYNIEGIELACASSNTRYGKRNDSLVITLDEKSTISGIFTSNSFKEVDKFKLNSIPFFL